MSQYNETRILSNAYKEMQQQQLQKYCRLRSDIIGEPSFGNSYPSDCTFISEASDAVVSMTRATQIVEIGIKSQVWRQVSISNALEYPTPGLTEDLRQTGSTYNLGQLDRYLKRYSFFRLQFRISGNGNEVNEQSNPWRDLLEDGKLFCVQGAPHAISTTSSKSPALTLCRLTSCMSSDSTSCRLTCDYQIQTRGTYAVALFSWNGNDKTVTTINARPGWTISFNGQNVPSSTKTSSNYSADLFVLVRMKALCTLSKYNNGRDANVVYDSLNLVTPIRASGPC